MDYLVNLIKARLEICLKMLSNRNISRNLKKQYLDEFEYLKDLPADENKLKATNCRYCKKEGVAKVCHHCGKEWKD